MALYSETLDDIVETVCKLVHDWWAGTVTGTAAANYINDATNRLEQDDYWNGLGAYLYIRSGGAVGDWRKVSDFANTGAKITAVANFTATPVAGDKYSLHVEYPRDEVVEMINLALNMVAEEALTWKIDETSVELVSSVYEYPLPSGFSHIYRVTMADSNGNFYDLPFLPDQYKIVHDSVTPKLHFFADADITAGRLLQIEGLGAPEALVEDVDICPINPAYLAFQAAALLHASRISSTETDPDDHRIQFGLWQGKADIERIKVVRVQRPPNSKRVHE